VGATVTVIVFQAAKRKMFWMIALCLVYIQIMLILSHGLPMDRSISNMFFDFSCHAENARQCWLLDKSDQHLTFLLHNLPVRIYDTIGGLALCLLLAGFWHKRLRKYRELSILSLIGLIAVPGIVALLKAKTGHYCPGQLAAYGGPVGVPGAVQPNPRCFPAGFPAGGFSFLVLYFGTLPNFWKRFGLYAGLGLGGVSSIIQIARGEHFLSHCLATLMTALFIGMLVSLSKKYWRDRYDALIGN
jgi:membrane-associated PAP2 superfamily phosphatase